MASDLKVIPFPTRSCAEANEAAQNEILIALTDADLAGLIRQLSALYTRQNEAADKTLRSYAKALQERERRCAL